jgi:uncharacterized RDD family membrane protein YckC
MKCPKCGFTSFDHLDTCSKCNTKLGSARESLGLAATTAAAAAIEVEARGPARPAPPRKPAAARKPAAPSPAKGREIAFEEPVEKAAAAELGLELDTSVLEAAEPAGAKAAQAAPSPAEKAGADSEPALELEAILEPLVLDEAPDEGPPQEAAQEPAATTGPEEEPAAGSEEESAAATGPEEEPVAAAGSEEESVATAGSEEEPAAATGSEEESVAAAEEESPPPAAASGPKKPGVEFELPEELSGLVAAAEKEVGEEETAAGPEEGAVELGGGDSGLTESEDKGEGGADKADLTPGASGPAVDLEMDEELKKFLEQEGTSLEELNSKDDDEEPPAAAGGGEEAGEGGGEHRLALDNEGSDTSRSACEGEAPARAAFLLRALAFGVDTSLLLVLLLALLTSAVAAFYWAALRLGTAADPMSLLRLALVMVPLGVPLTVFVLGLAYFSCFHGLAGGTPGKMLLGLEVRSLEGGRLGCGRALLRSVSYLLSALPLALGFLWAIGAERLAWHDLMAGSEVLRA